MKIKVIKCSVGGMNSDIVMFDEEFICDESEFSFKMSDKEMAGGLKSDRRFVCGVDQIAKYQRNYGVVS